MRLRTCAYIVVALAVGWSGCTNGTDSSASAPFSSVIPAQENPGSTLYVVNGLASSKGWVSIYSGLGKALLREIPTNPPDTGVFAAAMGGRFFLTSGKTSGTLTVYSQQGATIVQTLKQRHLFGPLLPDAFGNLYAGCKTLGHLCQYAPGTRQPYNPHVKRNLAIYYYPFGLSVDGAGNVAVSNGANGVEVFAPGQHEPYWVIAEYNTVYVQNAFDAAGNLYVITYPRDGGGSEQIGVYPPGATSPARVIANGASAPVNLLFDATGNLYVLNYCSSACSVAHPSISVYPPGANTPSRTITKGFADDQYASMAVDAPGHVAVALHSMSPSDPGSVLIFPPGGNSAVRTITSGIQQPVAVTIGN